MNTRRRGRYKEHAPTRPTHEKLEFVVRHSPDDLEIDRAINSTSILGGLPSLKIHLKIFS